MSTALRGRVLDRVPDSLGGFGAALAVAVGGAVAGLISALVTPPVYGAVAPPESALGGLLLRFVVQPGMGAFAAGYLWWRSDLELPRPRRPTLEGVVWIAIGPPAYEGVTAVARVGVSALGLATGDHAGGPATWRVLVENPALAVPGLLVLFVVVAPMEEVVYRGLVHAELAAAFGVAGRVVLGASLFGAMHFLLSGGVSSLLLTGAGGLVFAAAYERTDNLVVPVAIHALYWLAT
jgi:membrane protease YdiL (CAAX protease family)